MSLSTIGVISAVNDCVTLFQWAKSAISSLHSQWSGSQQQDLQGRVSQLESGLQGLRDTIPVMHDLINKAEWRSHDDVVASLLPNLKDAVSDAEDLIDEFRWYEKKVEVEGDASQSHFIDFFDTVIHGSFNKLDGIQLRLSSLSSQMENMGLHGVTQRFDRLLRPETTSFPSETKIFGRDKELKQVLKFLNVPLNSKRKRATSAINASTSTAASNHVNSESSPPVSVIGGIGGVGKTTLAQLICSHERVRSRFKKIIWICISDDFDVKRLTKEAIQSYTGKEAKTDNLDSLQHALFNHVRNKRLLIVLDDVWDDALKENGQCWKRFCAPFRSVKAGSTMLVTTRCPKVTDGVCTMEPVILQGLKGDIFWNFFRLCVFGSESSENYPELEQIGRRILPKLKGSPLAAKTLGRMLSMDLQASHWNYILESELWELRQEETDILPALRLSYMYLPFYLKQCFSFCAVYPKDYKFEKKCLAEIWVAEGYVEPQGGVPIHDIGCLYFQDLVARSFFQEVSGGYVIHDLIHDMAQKVSEHDCFILRNKSDFDKVPRNVRHLYVLSSSDFEDSNLLGLCKYTKLRTLLCMNSLGKEARLVMDHWCTKLPRMRVISCASADELPDSIGNWKHLRYLEISGSCCLKRIPSTFCWLYNLQILYANECKLETFPSDFSKLISLRKLKSHGLTYYVGMLSKDHAAEDELKLDMYSQRFIGFPKSEIIRDNDIEVLQVLQPPTSLESLFLQDYAGVSLPSWFQPKNLPSLKSLKFVGCVGLESISFPMISQSIEIPAVADFLSLTHLIIKGCGNLSSLEHFLHPDYVPAIKKIIIEDCKMLASIPTEKFGGFHFLQFMLVHRCPNIHSQRLVSPSLELLSLTGSGLLCNINCCSLTYFYFECEFITSIQLQTWCLPAVKELSIVCKSLTSIGRSITAFSSLNILAVKNCDNLSTLDDLLIQEYLPAIEKIDIECCCELLSLPIERFGSSPGLRHLVVDNCPKINWQRGLVLPSSLQRLKFTLCGDISPCVPSCLQNLTSLVSLVIAGVGLTSIPGDIWHNNLVLLEELVIWGCPDLVSFGGAKAVAKIKKVLIYECPNLRGEKEITISRLRNDRRARKSKCPELHYVRVGRHGDNETWLSAAMKEKL